MEKNVNSNTYNLILWQIDFQCKNGNHFEMRKKKKVGQNYQILERGNDTHTDKINGDYCLRGSWSKNTNIG